MSPNLSGTDAIDVPPSVHLVVRAFDIAERVLNPEACALIKLFQGRTFQRIVAPTRRKFARVTLCKPEASRSRSPGLYLLAKGFRLV